MRAGFAQNPGCRPNTGTIYHAVKLAKSLNSHGHGILHVFFSSHISFYKRSLIAKFGADLPAGIGINVDNDDVGPGRGQHPSRRRSQARAATTN